MSSSISCISVSMIIAIQRGAADEGTISLVHLYMITRWNKCKYEPNFLLFDPHDLFFASTDNMMFGVVFVLKFQSYVTLAG